MILFEWRWRFKWHSIKRPQEIKIFLFFFVSSFFGQWREGLLFRKWYAKDYASMETRFLRLSLSLAFSKFPRINAAFSPYPTFLFPPPFRLSVFLPPPPQNYAWDFIGCDWGGWSGRSEWQQYQADIASWICRWWRAHPGSGRSPLAWFPLGCRALLLYTLTMLPAFSSRVIKSHRRVFRLLNGWLLLRDLSQALE